MPNGFSFLPTFSAGALSNIQVLQNVVLITWSSMGILNSVISGNNLPALSHAFDDVLFNVWLFKVIYMSAMNLIIINNKISWT